MNEERESFFKKAISDGKRIQTREGGIKGRWVDCENPDLRQPDARFRLRPSVAILCAEACGWYISENGKVVEAPDGTRHYCDKASDVIPEYETSTDAINTAAETLNPIQKEDFADALCRIVSHGQAEYHNVHRHEFFRCITATATQRAEAFLEVVGGTAKKTKATRVDTSVGLSITKESGSVNRLRFTWRDDGNIRAVAASILLDWSPLAMARFLRDFGRELEERVR